MYVSRWTGATIGRYGFGFGASAVSFAASIQQILNVHLGLSAVVRYLGVKPSFVHWVTQIASGCDKPRELSKLIRCASDT